MRQSNTMPQVKMTAEAKTEKRLREIIDEAEALIKDSIKRLSSRG